MNKLHFTYGAMGSAKTANALMTVINYQLKGKNVLLLKPSIDTRDDSVDTDGKRVSMVKSRVGLSSVANIFEPEDNMIDYLKDIEKTKKIDIIVCDECQFLTEKQVEELKYIAVYRCIPVFCFGLLSDFQAKLFPGSAKLFVLADIKTELHSACRCGANATINARLDKDGNVIAEGAQVEIGGDDRYEGMCWKCWYEHLNKHTSVKPKKKIRDVVTYYNEDIELVETLYIDENNSIYLVDDNHAGEFIKSFELSPMESAHYLKNKIEQMYSMNEGISKFTKKVIYWCYDYMRINKKNSAETYENDFLSFLEALDAYKDNH